MKSQSWQSFPHVVHLTAVVCSVSMKRSLAQLFLPSCCLLSMECFPLKVKWAFEILQAECLLSYHSTPMPSSKIGFDVYLKWLSTPLSFPGSVSLCETVICSSLPHVRRPAAHEQWGCPSTTSRSSWIMLMAARGYIVAGSGGGVCRDIYTFWNYRKHHAVNVSQSCRPLTFWGFVLAFVDDGRQP